MSQDLASIGYKRGVGHPSTFYHADKDIMTLVHGDDYFSCGSDASLDWLDAELRKLYEIKSQRIACRDVGPEEIDQRAQKGWRRKGVGRGIPGPVLKGRSVEAARSANCILEAANGAAGPARCTDGVLKSKVYGRGPARQAEA